MKPARPITCLEWREQDLVQRDRYRTAHGDAQRVVVKEGHPGQHAAEEDELQRNRTDLRAGKGAVAAGQRQAGQAQAERECEGGMPSLRILIGVLLLRRILEIAA
jgi:hypothetical protein